MWSCRIQVRTVIQVQKMKMKMARVTNNAWNSLVEVVSGCRSHHLVRRRLGCASSSEARGLQLSPICLCSGTMTRQLPWPGWHGGCRVFVYLLPRLAPFDHHHFTMASTQWTPPMGVHPRVHLPSAAIKCLAIQYQPMKLVIYCQAAANAARLSDWHCYKMRLAPHHLT